MMMFHQFCSSQLNLSANRIDGADKYSRRMIKVVIGLVSDKKGFSKLKPANYSLERFKFSVEKSNPDPEASQQEQAESFQETIGTLLSPDDQLPLILADLRPCLTSKPSDKAELEKLENYQKWLEGINSRFKWSRLEPTVKEYREAKMGPSGSPESWGLDLKGEPRVLYDLIECLGVLLGAVRLAATFTPDQIAMTPVGTFYSDCLSSARLTEDKEEKKKKKKGWW